MLHASNCSVISAYTRALLVEIDYVLDSSSSNYYQIHSHALFVTSGLLLLFLYFVKIVFFKDDVNAHNSNSKRAHSPRRVTILPLLLNYPFEVSHLTRLMDAAVY